MFVVYFLAVNFDWPIILIRKSFGASRHISENSERNWLYQEALSSVKLNGLLPDQFKVEQGVRQGGVMSADFYKLYDNNTLLRVDKSGYCASVGTISVVLQLAQMMSCLLRMTQASNS